MTTLQQLVVLQISTGGLSSSQVVCVWQIAVLRDCVVLIICRLEDGEARRRRNKRELMQDLHILQDATRRWRSSKAAKLTRTHRCKTFKCCKILLEDEGDETRPRGCKYPTPPCALAKILPETTVRA